MTVSVLQVRECFFRLCGQAVHAHQEELREGFITTRDGFRVGVAGTAVVRDGAVTSYRDITSLCIRIPRAIPGCALPLLSVVSGEHTVNGMLLCGAPSCGKTTLLRDLARLLSSSYRVAVVDERRELALAGPEDCDVLSGTPKAVGILQAVRTLAPDAVIVDEIGDRAEWEAVARAVFCGVAVIGSVHAACERELTARKEVSEVLRCGGFPYVAFLPPRRKDRAGIRIRKAAELFEDLRSDNDYTGVYGCGDTRVAEAL